MQNEFLNQEEHANFFINALAYKGSVTPLVLKKVVFIFIYASLISYINYFYPTFNIPIGPFEYAGLMMGLILVFRINAGYDRWWEARKLWGSIVNASRNLAVVVKRYSTSEKEVHISKIYNYISAIPFLIKNHLRSEKSIEEIKDLIDFQIYNNLLSEKNKPLALSTELAKELYSIKVNDGLDGFSFLKAEEQRAIIIDCLGACERILKTPMPFVMAIKSRRFIFIFLITLPLALVNVSPLINPIISSLVAYAIFSLDQISVELQKPFCKKSLSHLALDEICSNIQNNVLDISRLD
jgi:putative membrane protein